MTRPSPQPSAELTSLLPQWHFREQHQRTVTGSPADAYDAFRALSLRELPASRVLFAIRSLPSRLTGGIALPTSSQAPMVDLMLDAGFRLLADTPGREIVVGLVEQVTRLGAPTSRPPGDPHRPDSDENHDAPGRRAGKSRATGDLTAAAAEFRSYDQPGAVKIAMTLLFTGLGGGRTSVYTETRVLATDDAARRRFALYWLGIRTFSGLIRLEWLRAIARRTAKSSAG